MRFVLYLCASLFLAGCASHSGDDLQPKTVGSVNLKRYQGTWYELARLPMYFQRNCAQSEARYSLLPDGDMSIATPSRIGRSSSTRRWASKAAPIDAKSSAMTPGARWRSRLCISALRLALA